MYDKEEPDEHNGNEDDPVPGREPDPDPETEPATLEQRPCARTRTFYNNQRRRVAVEQLLVSRGAEVRTSGPVDLVGRGMDLRTT